MELFKLLGTISVDTNSANEAIDRTTGKAKDSEKQQSGAFKRIGMGAATLAKGVVGAGAAIGGAFIAVTEGTREYRVSMGKLETAFTTSGHSAETAHKTYNDLNAVLGDSDVAVEAANHLAKLTDNQQDLQTWTDICTGVFATFGDSLPIEGLTESANETAKTGQLVGNLVDALNWAGESEDDFQAKLDGCSTEQERQALITDTLNGLYSEAANKYKEVNKDVIEAEKAQGRLTAAFAEVGKVAEPMMTFLKNGLAAVIEAILPFIQSFAEKIPAAFNGTKGSFSVFSEYLKTGWQALWTVLQTAWNTVGKPVFDFIKSAVNQLLAYWQKNLPAAAAVWRDVFTIIKNLWNQVLKPVLKIIGDYVKTTLLPIWKASFDAIMKVVQVVFDGIIKLWNGSLKPILNGIISFVSGVLTGNWTKAWNGIKQVVSGVFSGIKTIISTALEVVKSLFSSGLGVVKSTVSNIFGNIKTAISEKMEGAKTAVKNAIEKIKSAFSFKWKLPDLKLPKISVKGSFSLKPPSAPSFGLKWNAEGGILTKPTIFGMSGNTFMGGGEAGHEAVLPVEKLKAYVSDSVKSQNDDLIAAFEIQISRLILFMQNYFPADFNIMLDSGALVGELAPAIDGKLADIYRNNKRGNTR